MKADVANQTRWQRQQIAKGLCVQCTEPAVRGQRCARHHARRLEEHRRCWARRSARVWYLRHREALEG